MRLIDADALKKEISYEYVDGIMSPENYCVMHFKLVNAPNAELWHDIKTDPPTKSSSYITHFNRIVSVAYYDNDLDQWYDDKGREVGLEFAEHWMEIPKLPESPNEEYGTCKTCRYFSKHPYLDHLCTCHNICSDNYEKDMLIENIRDFVCCRHWRGRAMSNAEL